jgi:hypothetical protein
MNTLTFGKIDYDAMRIKLDFLFRIIDTMNSEAQSEGVSHEIVTELLGNVLMAGTAVIHKYRTESGFTLNPQEAEACLAIGDYMLNRFVDLHSKIFEAVSGMPITLLIGKKELMIREGIDEMINWLKTFYAAGERELSNG